jgi:hypothetical protein
MPRYAPLPPRYRRRGPLKTVVSHIAAVSSSHCTGRLKALIVGLFPTHNVPEEKQPLSTTPTAT